MPDRVGRSKSSLGPSAFERASTSGGKKTNAARAALRVLAQRGVVKTWGAEDVEAMQAALKAAADPCLIPG